MLLRQLTVHPACGFAHCFSRHSQSVQRLPITLERRSWWRSWRWSAVLHVWLAVAIVVEAIWLPLPFFAVQPVAAKPLLVVEQSEADQSTFEIEVQIEERPWMARDAEDATYAEVDFEDPRWAHILTEPERRTAGEDLSQADDAASVLISSELMRSIEASGRQADEENLRRLQALSGRLTTVSSEETIDELSGTIGRLVGTTPRASRPQENVAGNFDLSTSQPHDCRKETSLEGKVQYVMVMIDRAGRMQEVAMDEASGEQLYQTMQLIKSNPLLERVYRGVVMGLLDKLLQPTPTK